jgi:hypothetical protein
LNGPEEDEEFEKISQSIQVYSIQEIIELLHNSQSSEERSKAILYLGVSITGEFIEEVFAEFINVLQRFSGR